MGEGGAFVPIGTNLTFYTSALPPAVSAVSPSYGDVGSGAQLEVAGWNFAPVGGLACSVAGQVMPATFIDAQHARCAAPPSRQQSPITVAVAAGVGDGPVGASANFTYYVASEPPTLLPAAVPSYLPVGGEATVRLHGRNFAPTGEAFVCRFGDSHVSRATFVSVGGAVCLAPSSHRPGSVQVQLSTNAGGSFSNGLVFTRYDDGATAEPRSLSPPAVRTRRATTIMVDATNLAPTAGLACGFGGKAVSPATFDSTRLRCVAPAMEAAGQLDLRLTLGDGSWSNGSLPIVFYDPDRRPVLRAISRNSSALAVATPPVTVFGEGFAPTGGALRCRFSAVVAAGGGGGGDADERVQVVAASFVSMRELRCHAPHSATPVTFHVAATVDGQSYGESSLTFTFFDASVPPTLTSLQPIYGHYAFPTHVTIAGTNFAPDALMRVRWGANGVSEATFASSTALTARTVTPRGGLVSQTVRVEVSSPGGRPYPLAAGGNASFTFFDPSLPAGLTSVTPVQGRCAVGGRTVYDTRTGEAVEVASGAWVEVAGANFAPTPRLSCGFAYMGAKESVFGLSAFHQNYEYWVPAVFETGSHIRCPIPTTRFAGGIGYLTKPLHLSTTNDGVTSRYTNHTYTYTGDCLPAPVVLWLGGLVLALLVLTFVCGCVLTRRPAAASDDSELQKRWLTRVMQQVQRPPPAPSPHPRKHTCVARWAAGWGRMGRRLHHTPAHPISRASACCLLHTARRATDACPAPPGWQPAACVRGGVPARTRGVPPSPGEIVSGIPPARRA